MRLTGRRLTEAEKAEIRCLYRERAIEVQAIAARYGVSRQTIVNVANRKRKRKKAPTPCTSSGRDPHEADQTSYCRSDNTASLTKTEEGI